MVPKYYANIVFSENNTKLKELISFKRAYPLFPPKRSELSDFWSFLTPEIAPKKSQRTFYYFSSYFSLFRFALLSILAPNFKKSNKN